MNITVCPRDAQCALIVRPYGLQCVIYAQMCDIRSPDTVGKVNVAGEFLYPGRKNLPDHGSGM